MHVTASNWLSETLTALCTALTPHLRVPLRPTKSRIRTTSGYGLDEFGGNHFTFRAYFRLEDFTAATRKKLLDKATRSDLAGVFHLTSFREPERQVVIDEANSRFCKAAYVDGDWQRKDTVCNESIPCPRNM
jgi:hypothetical protein